MNKSTSPTSTDLTHGLERRSVGMIGLGLLGSALGERLVDAGYDVHIWNRTREKGDGLVARGARWSDNPFKACERVVVCLYTTDVVEQVLGEFESGMRAGQILIDATTGEPELAARLGERLAEKRVAYLESPIAASSEQTRRGEALAIVGGPRETFDACSDLFAALTSRAIYVGHWGSAGRIKLVNNLVLGLNRAALAEGLLFAESVGLDPLATLEVLRAGNCYSRAMDVKGQKMIDRDFTTQAKLSQHAKDIGIVLEAAGGCGRTLPFTELHLQMLRFGESLGLGEVDNCAIIEAIDQRSQNS